jgi:ankyrin repeat protein
MRLLLGLGGDAEIPDICYDRTQLSWAAERGHEAMVKLLLETGQANVESKDGARWTPLSWAAERGHEAVVKLLQPNPT